MLVNVVSFLPDSELPTTKGDDRRSRRSLVFFISFNFLDEARKSVLSWRRRCFAESYNDDAISLLHHPSLAKGDEEKMSAWSKTEFFSKLES